MCLSSKIAELRNELLQNCKYAIGCLEVAERMVTHIVSTNQMPTITSSHTSSIAVLSTQSVTDSSIQFPQMSGSKPDDATSYKITDEILNRFMILTHGVLIQEWEHFLYDVFMEGVIYYLKGYDLDPDCKLHLKILLKILKPGIEVAEMRKKLSAEVKKSLKGYEDLFKKSRKLFKVEEDKLLEEMKKHVQVRHVFQHNRGEIREEDLIAIGMSENVPDRCFSILDDKGQMRKYKKGETIFLSKLEIQKLLEIIEKYSQVFQTQTEKAKPITE
jgi:hypothetical protein